MMNWCWLYLLVTCKSVSMCLYRVFIPCIQVQHNVGHRCDQQVEMKPARTLCRADTGREGSFLRKSVVSRGGCDFPGRHRNPHGVML